ncbi:alanyl-tRNA editing protein [Cryobacterium tepidiphilum]|uniref:Metal-dependent hydrolase n=1 Tax=Cryobacterium tepidiphilum TaxID=2486026 RepID=A0A3M8KUQ1_9MICO|nr:metal-dependent hydrolase [Cryobacterium tepidiphilum]RNE57010.1 metal-dependent hydrolase [Cryobacterium tepidiphilum]
MTLPTQDTRVDYPVGALETATVVLHTEPVADGRTAVLLEATSAHPLDAGWPDQGPDRASILVGAVPLAVVAAGGAATPTSVAGDLLAGSDELRSIPVVDCVVAATDGSALHLGRDIPVPKGTPGWAFVVAHLVDGDPGLREGDRVEVVVDASFRHSISAGHTACHLASLALNRALADRWKKEVRPDALAQPDFDGTAIDASLIRENGSTDTYRLGKSLRKKGFITDGLVDVLPDVQAAVEQTLADWLATDAAVRIERDGELLTDRRYWVCELPGGAARIPCGGTHLASLGELAQIGGLSVRLTVADVDGTPVLTMETDLV